MTLAELESALRSNPGNINAAHALIEGLRAECERKDAALRKWLAYDNCDEADFTQVGPMLLYADAIEATKSALASTGEG